MTRKMASVQRIDEITPIEGADQIECARVGGWKVVVKKGEFQAGSLAIYCEIDSFIPNSVAPFLTRAGHEPKEYNGMKGERLKTVKLRGQISQGLLLPMCLRGSDGLVTGDIFVEGDDVTDFLWIQKWESPELAGTNVSAKGNFPSFIRKTDQERVQNLTKGNITDVQRRALSNAFAEAKKLGIPVNQTTHYAAANHRFPELYQRYGSTFEVTVKMDGSSCTVYVKDGVRGVCSRNIDLKEDDANAFWAIAKKNSLHEKIEASGRNLAIQGELVAPNIQSNWEKVNEPQFHCFSIWDIDKQAYLLPEERRQMCKALSIPHIKVLDENFVLNHSCDELLEMAEGPGVNPNVKREGLVFKSNTEDFSFKAISNSYLLKKG